MTEYLGLADFLVIAEAVTGVPAEVLALSLNLHRIDRALNTPAASVGGQELYSDIGDKAAALVVRLIESAALPNNNLPVAYEALQEFIARNAARWTPPSGDGSSGELTVKVVLDLAHGRTSETEFAAWIRDRIRED